MFRYFFLDNYNIAHSKNSLKKTPRIVKFDPIHFWIKGLPTPIPSYTSLNDLIKHDKRFKEYKRKYPSTAKIILQEGHFINLHGMVFSSSKDDSQAANMLKHTMEGNRKSKSFTGVHHIENPPPPYIINFNLIEPPDSKGVYVASFDIMEKGKVLSKQENSTMFPNSWTTQQVYDECLHALNTKIIIDESRHFYKSTTQSGIPVEIYFDEKGNLKTLYPIRESKA